MIFTYFGPGPTAGSTLWDNPYNRTAGGQRVTPALGALGGPPDTVFDPTGLLLPGGRPSMTARDYLASLGPTTTTSIGYSQNGLGPFLLITPPPPASAWLPTSRAGLLAWWRSDLGITLNSGNVSMWADQSGNGHALTQATGSAQPAYNVSGGPGGKPSITYAGAQTLTTLTAICAGTSPRSVFIQMSNSASPSTSSFDILRFGLGNPALTIRYDNYTGLGDLTTADGSFNNTGSYTADNAPHLITVTHTSGTIDPYYMVVQATRLSPRARCCSATAPARY